MVVVKDWKTYYTMEESSQILDERLEKRAKSFAQKVVSRNTKKHITESTIKKLSYV